MRLNSVIAKSGKICPHKFANVNFGSPDICATETDWHTRNFATNSSYMTELCIRRENWSISVAILPANYLKNVWSAGQTCWNKTAINISRKTTWLGWNVQVLLSSTLLRLIIDHDFRVCLSSRTTTTWCIRTWLLLFTHWEKPLFLKTFQSIRCLRGIRPASHL